MPDGFMRKYTPISQSTQDIINAIDKTISETGFDIERYLRIKNIASQYITMTYDIANNYDSKNPDMKKRADCMAYATKMEKYQEIRGEMLLPIYERLVELGFNERALKG